MNEGTHGRKVKIFRIAEPYLLRLGRDCREKCEIIENIIPDDAVIVDITWDGANGWADVVIHSDSFEEVPEGGELSFFTPVIRTIYYD